MAISRNQPPVLSIVIPAHNEAKSLPETLTTLSHTLTTHHISHEILVVNDHSSDSTELVVLGLKNNIPEIELISNNSQRGFGHTIITGLNAFKGQYVAIFMADQSDDPSDLVKFYNTAIETGVDAVFGSRFVKGGRVVKYPLLKLWINRCANNLVRLLFHVSYNDCTNAFKLYKRETIDGLRPFLAGHFNLTLELPLKVIVRGYSYRVLPNSWYNRKHGRSNLKNKEMGGRYLFIMLYCLIERYFSKGDFKKMMR